MSTAIARQEVDDASIFALVTNGDASKLTPAQKLAYYKARCEAAGLDYRTQPFQFIKLQGREVLYALKAATDQLAAQHKIRCEIVDQRTENDVRVVTVRAVCADGRQTDEIGAVSVKSLGGEALCNALMKAVTKAKRRAVISVTGLGMLDETELETIRDVTPAVSALPTPRRKSEKAALPPKEESPDLTGALRASVEAARKGAAPASAEPPPADVSSRPAAHPAGGAAPSPSDEVPLFDPETGEVIEEGPLVNAKDLKRIFSAAKDGRHPDDAVKAWLYRTYAVSSSKQIPASKVNEVIMRLADPTELPGGDA